MSDFEKSLENYKKISPLFPSHKHETEREGFEDTTGATQSDFFPVVWEVSHREVHSGDSASDSPLLLKKVLTLRTRLSPTKKWEKCFELQVQN